MAARVGATHRAAPWLLMPETANLSHRAALSLCSRFEDEQKVSYSDNGCQGVWGNDTATKPRYAGVQTHAGTLSTEECVCITVYRGSGQLHSLLNEVAFRESPLCCM